MPELLHQLVHDLADALTGVLLTIGSERGRAFAAAKAQLADSAAENADLEADPAIFRAWRRTVKALARTAGGPTAWLWVVVGCAASVPLLFARRELRARKALA